MSEFESRYFWHEDKLYKIEYRNITSAPSQGFLTAVELKPGKSFREYTLKFEGECEPREITQTLHYKLTKDGLEPFNPQDNGKTN